MTESHYTLAPYAITAARSAGRVYDEPGDPLRDPFALDRHRIVESTAFRRLERKTQVFAPTFDDHIRTRLTHTLEAALIARTLAGALRVNQTLTEAITLAHDLGHPPFGHAGEVALNELMKEYGGFNHNAHSVRVVEYLEHPFPPFRGLNLTRGTLDGLRLHTTRYDDPSGAIEETGGSVEAQVASAADRIAYNCHDLEDAIGAGLITLDALRDTSLWRSAYDAVAARFPHRPIYAIRRIVLDDMLNRILLDIVRQSEPRLARLSGPDDTIAATEPLVSPSPAVEAQLAELELFLLQSVYRHPDVARTDAAGQALICQLFDAYLADPSRLPERFHARLTDQRPHRIICDYIAGMTDQFCRTTCDQLT